MQENLSGDRSSLTKYALISGPDLNCRPNRNDLHNAIRVIAAHAHDRLHLHATRLKHVILCATDTAPATGQHTYCVNDLQTHIRGARL